MSRCIQRRAGRIQRAIAIVGLIVTASREVHAATLAGTGTDHGTGRADTTAIVPYLSSRTSVLPAGVRDLVVRARLAATVPSFARQTGLACSACHYQFPQLTPFGRLFKINGYSLTGLKTIKEGDKKKEAGLALVPIGHSP